MAKQELLVGPLTTQPGTQGGLGYDKVATPPPFAPKDPLGLIKK